MAVSPAMFIFEVVVESVQSYVESRHLIIRSDFADVFSLELKDPKQMYIVIPDPPPLPPEPPGKKGKKKAKPKKPKGKKGKKGKIELPPPEPAIQSGQSVLFSSTAEFLIQCMKKFPLDVSLWSKEDTLVFIGSSTIPWDPVFLVYLEKISNFLEALPVTVKDSYNVFEEGTAKLMAKLGLQVKLTYLGDKVTTAFRTLSEDLNNKKYLYTGINSKTTSYICTLKTTDEDFEENCNKIENNYIKDKPKPQGKIVYADYKNVPGANLTFFNEGDYCCMSHADKPPESIYKSPETCPDVDFIVDYVRKIIVSCNDNMRMLTPRPAIKPTIKATDIDRLCYCKETKWPEGKFSQKFKKEVQGDSCPICIDAGKPPTGPRGITFDIANIRGPCGRPDCRIARDMRAYIEKLVEEDAMEINLDDIIGPCGSKVCTLAEKIQEFLRHEGVFNESRTKEGLSTQCACVQQMQEAFQKKMSCDTICSKDCVINDNSSQSDVSCCSGKDCPFQKEETGNKNFDQQVYNVYYFTVENFANKPKDLTPPESSKSSKHNYCSTDCPSTKPSTACSKASCSISTSKKKSSAENSKCQSPVCPSKYDTPSPADSDIVVEFDDIHNPCCVKSCNVVDKVKEFIVEGVTSKKNKSAILEDDPCFCDCVCDFHFSRNTTYCTVCGGYECLGDDMRDQPAYAKPHPCPIYHKLYDKKYINVKSPFPEEHSKKPTDNISLKSLKKQANKESERKRSLTGSRSARSFGSERKSEKKEKPKEKIAKVKTEKKKIGKFTVNVQETDQTLNVKKPEKKYPYPAVPKRKGWNWNLEDVPGLKFRAKWKPGAANKILVRRYRTMRHGIDIMAKKKRALMQRKKKLEMKPTVVVKKKNGEYTVQMEVFKTYSKERMLFQYPYEERTPLVYTIGRTEEENRKIQKQRERRERRETRRKSRMLQSTFRNKCQEICLKAYNQAIGALPLPNPNDPECPCFTAQPELDPIVDSCSCSDEGSISTSDSDGDEWVIEFTPPAARWDPKLKHPPILAENECQYSYLDYKVKLLDKSGNQVPRFFKGPDGKQECSDLGGFWDPKHFWTEINKDGYIGPDNRWVPMNFIGPDGMYYSAEEGFFTDNSGENLKIGIDGYIDKDGKWAWYSKRRGPKSNKSAMTVTTVDTKRGPKRGTPEVDDKSKTVNKSKPPVSSIVKNKVLDKNNTLAKPNTLPASKAKKSVSYSSGKKHPAVMSVSVNYERANLPKLIHSTRMNAHEQKKLAKYHEIMQNLEMYEDLRELMPVIKTNRASNTSRKKTSPYTTFGINKRINNLSIIKSFAHRTDTSSDIAI